METIDIHEELKGKEKMRRQIKKNNNMCEKEDAGKYPLNCYLRHVPNIITGCIFLDVDCHFVTRGNNMDDDFAILLI